MSQVEELMQLMDKVAQGDRDTQVAIGTIVEYDSVNQIAKVSSAGDEGSISITHIASGLYPQVTDRVFLIKPARSEWIIAGKVVGIGEEDFSTIARVGTQPVPVDRTSVGPDRDRIDAPTGLGSFLFVAYRTVENGPLTIQWFELTSILQAQLGTFPSASGTYYAEFEFSAGVLTMRGFKTPAQVLSKLIPYRSSPPPVSGINGNLYLDSSL